MLKAMTFLATRKRGYVMVALTVVMALLGAKGGHHFGFGDPNF